MSVAQLIRDMAAAGAPAEAIALAVDAIEAAEAKLGAQREAARDRKRRQRAGQSRDGHGTVTGHSDDSHAQPPHPLPLPPQTPPTPTPAPPEYTTPARGLGCAKPSGFARFWEAYPNKVAKQAAERAWLTACRKIGGPDPPAVLLEGLERAKTSQSWLDGYIPHPTTWLNQGRWEDEPSAKPNQRQPHDRPDRNDQPTPRQDRLGRMLAGAVAAVDE